MSTTDKLISKFNECMSLPFHKTIGKKLSDEEYAGMYLYLYNSKAIQEFRKEYDESSTSDNNVLHLLSKALHKDKNAVT